MVKAARAPRRSWLWLQGAVAGGTAAILPGVALTIGVLLCPAMFFYMTEKADGRPISRAMLLCGSTALFRPLRTLWNHGGGLANALDLLADPGCPILAWVACAAGWLLCETAHTVTRLTSQLTVRQQIGTLEAERTLLLAEWTAGEPR